MNRGLTSIYCASSLLIMQRMGGLKAGLGRAALYKKILAER